MANIKICGLQSVEVLKSMIHLPVDYVGFVFAPSKRKVEPEQAAEIAACLRDNHDGGGDIAMPKMVGVFVNPTQDEITRTLGIVPLNAVQLHGGESPEFCRWVREVKGVTVVKAFSIRDTDGKGAAEGPIAEGGRLAPAIREQLDAYSGAIDILLIDTYDPHYGGGSGKTFRWELIPAYAEWARSNGVQLFIAGGLQPDNVQNLLGRYEVDGVDVSSGVETNGVKDIEKIRTFVERVKHHEQTA